MKLLIITLFICLCHIFPSMAQKTERIYKELGDSVFVQKRYVEPFDFGYQNLSSFEVTTCHVTSKDSSQSYQVKLSNYRGTEEDGGYYRMIEIVQNGQTIMCLKQSDGWDKLQKHLRSYSNNDYFLSIPLTSSLTALVFVGYSYNSQPELLTIVLLNKDKATLVFNKGMLIKNIIHDGISFVINLQDLPVEYISENIPANTPQLYQIFWENGELKLKGPLN